MDNLTEKDYKELYAKYKKKYLIAKMQQDQIGGRESDQDINEYNKKKLTEACKISKSGSYDYKTMTKSGRSNSNLKTYTEEDCPKKSFLSKLFRK
jgi:hypothetical protein